jgi:rhodanese-related sulfurtransferase
MKETKKISQLELKELIQNGQKLLIIDVRSQEEYDKQHIPNAINSPIEQIEKGELDIEKDTIIVTACGKGGGRSESASNYIQKIYSQDVYFLEGGTFGWFDEIFD